MLVIRGLLTPRLVASPRQSAQLARAQLSVRSSPALPLLRSSLSVDLPPLWPLGTAGLRRCSTTATAIAHPSTGSTCTAEAGMPPLPPGRVLPVVTYPAPVLREKAPPVADPRDPAIRQLVADLLATAVSEKCMGLAAPQVGASKRVFVLRTPRFRNDAEYSRYVKAWQSRGRGLRRGIKLVSSALGGGGAPAGGDGEALEAPGTFGVRFHACINPVVLSRSEAVDIGVEGCLSLPGHFALVRRPQRLEVEYVDGATGQLRRELLAGLPAAAFLHELDHLDGVLQSDREVTTVPAAGAGRRAPRMSDLFDEAGDRFTLELFKYYEGPEGTGKTLQSTHRPVHDPL